MKLELAASLLQNSAAAAVPSLQQFTFILSISHTLSEALPQTMPIIGSCISTPPKKQRCLSSVTQHNSTLRGFALAQGSLFV